ncbi:MAG: TRAP transporter large permease subunit, partial [Candidatus Deferrimicrobiaceae bacterium]
MDPRLPILLFGSFGALLFLNFPIAAALGISSVLAIAVFDLAPLELIPQQLLSATDSWTLLAVPFFILAGNILGKTAISERLIRLARVVVGQFPAGLAMVAVVVSIFFAGISGSGPADTAALGAILIPGMVAAGYDRRSAAALMAAGGGIGIIIPPSIALVIYGVVANASISKLFIAGILPGILVGLSLFAVSYLLFGKDPDIRPEKRGSLREIGAAFRDAAWGLLAPLIILGGIYGGIFTATEAATVAVVYGVVVGFFIHRDLKISDLPEILID